MDHLPKCLSEHHRASVMQGKVFVSYIFFWFLQLRLRCTWLVLINVWNGNNSYRKKNYGNPHTVFRSLDVCFESPQDHILEIHWNVLAVSPWTCIRFPASFKTLMEHLYTAQQKSWKILKLKTWQMEAYKMTKELITNICVRFKTKALFPHFHCY